MTSSPQPPHHTTLPSTPSKPNPQPQPSTSYPTTLADLSYTTTQTSIYHTLSLLSKRTLSLPNRLSSIHTDSLFVRHLATTIFPRFPVIANERCGSWYVAPDLKHGSAYFKSTDGHVGQWGFSLRRLNLGVLEMLACAGEGGSSGEDGGGGGKWTRKRGGGVIIVDSTRRGKRVPDALRRTVPCWVAVWNRVLFEGCEERGRREGWWGVKGVGLEEGEVALIEERVGGWVEGLKGLKLDLQALREKVRRPMRCVWAVHGEDGIDYGVSDRGGDVVETDDDDDDDDVDDGRGGGGFGDYYTLVLCSASRRVLGAEMSEDGYIQGAGDDSESWSHGLTAELFWKHKDQLMHAAEDDLPDLIEVLVQDAKATMRANQDILITPTINLFLAPCGIGHDGLLPAGYDAVINCNGAKKTEGKGILQLGCRSRKLGSRDLRESLAFVGPFVTKIFQDNPASKIRVTCETGNDLSVGVVLVLLCMYFDEKGALLVPLEPNRSIDKQFIKQRLAWITSCKPNANPSGSTLQAVNGFMMGRPP